MSNCDYERKAALKPHSVSSEKKRTHGFAGDIQAMIDNDPSKSTMSIAWDMDLVEFLIRPVVHEEI